jgi:hypothetical protein
VRELRTTEQTNVIVLYMGVVSSLGSGAICAAVPHSFVVPRTATEVLLLLGTGEAASSALRCAELWPWRASLTQRTAHPKGHVELWSILICRQRTSKQHKPSLYRLYH